MRQNQAPFEAPELNRRKIMPSIASKRCLLCIELDACERECSLLRFSLKYAALPC